MARTKQPTAGKEGKTTPIDSPPGRFASTLNTPKPAGQRRQTRTRGQQSQSSSGVLQNARLSEEEEEEEEEGDSNVYDSDEDLETNVEGVAGASDIDGDNDESEGTIAERNRGRRKRQPKQKKDMLEQGTPKAKRRKKNDGFDVVTMEDLGDESHPLANVLQDTSNIKAGSMFRASKTVYHMRNVLQPIDFEIGMEGAVIIDNFKNSMDTYVAKLEYPKLYSYVRGYVFFLDVHVNLLVKYMMSIVNAQGLQADRVLGRALDNMVTEDFFGEGTGCVLSKNFVAALCTCKNFYISLTRIVDNFKQTLKKKVCLWRESLVDLIPDFTLPTGNGLYILREVRHSMYITSCHKCT